MPQYNNSVSLWNTDASRKAYPVVNVVEEFIHSNREGYVAECASKEQAQQILRESGYVEIGMRVSPGMGSITVWKVAN